MISNYSPDTVKKCYHMGIKILNKLPNTFKVPLPSKVYMTREKLFGKLFPLPALPW